MTGLGFGLVLGVILCGKNRFVRYGGLGAGIGAGMALEECAHDFNKIQLRVNRVNQWISEGKDDFSERRERLERI